MFLPVRNDSPLRNTPYMNWLLIAANVIVFMAQGANPALTGRYALYASHPTLPAFFTYQFLHMPGGLPLHLIFNMLFLYIFGNNVNDRLGHLGYLAFYLAGGVFAGVAQVVTSHGGGSIIGASGAIAAVTGAYLVLFPRSHITVYYFWFLIGRFEVPSLWFIAFFFAQDVFLGATGGDNVAHWAHIGGTLLGVSVCLLLLIVHLLPRDQFDVWALITRWNKRRQYRDLVSKGYNPFEFNPNDRLGKRGKLPPPDPQLERVTAMRGRIAEALDARNLEQAASIYLQLHTVDPAQVLSKQAQLEVATQLHHQGRYPQAAEAYEALLKTYPKVDRIEQIQLALGLIYARYLNQYAPAKQYLTQALDRLHGEREVSLAREELTHIELHLKPA